MKSFIRTVLCGVFFIMAFGCDKMVFAQTATASGKVDTTVKIQAPDATRQTRNSQLRRGALLPDPPNLVRTVEYDPATNRYILSERVGNFLYRPQRYLTYSEYLRLKQTSDIKENWKQLSDKYAKDSQQQGFIPQIKVRSETFSKIFGSEVIDIHPQGSAEVIFAGQINKNENPLFNTRQRNQGNFNFDQKIQMNVTGSIGDKLKISTNYNTEAQFQFENQLKLDYTGKPDEIIQKIEAGTVSMPLPTSLISGSQALFGVKTKMQFGKLNVTSIFSQQRSQSRQITISNGSQQGNFSLSPSDYEANRHYFLSQYFRNNYNKALANIPIISSNITITKIEVWVTNRSNTTKDSRDVLALLDLGEYNPYNKTLIRGGAGFSALPAGFTGPGFTQQSNNLLANLPANARLTNSNDIANYFQSTGRTDNYSKLTYARKLTTTEFVLHPQLGYISLNYPLNNDEVLSVAYRYTYNGTEYQVGELSTDIPVDAATPKVLYTKLLKNELLKTSLPTWDLMMKNIYTLGAYQISPNDFRLTITHLDDKSNIEKPIMGEGQNTTGKLWVQLTGLDNLNPQGAKQPDGYFDFLEGITIDSQNGRITFPVIEPFGADLASKFIPGTEQDLINRYVYQPLYDSTKTIAQQFFPQLNRYVIKGTYSSQAGSEFQLNAINIPQGSVVVTAGTLRLTEGSDYTVDYNIGRIRIINQALLTSGQPINIKLESNELYGIQQKSLYGSRFDYKMNNKLNLGATVMHLTEQPITQKVSIGDESISNTIYGFDGTYSSRSRLLTRLVDKLPFISTKAPSSINFSGEFAQLLPGHPAALNFAGTNQGTAYLDDFENSSALIDLKSAVNWQIAGTPQLFPESQLDNDLSYGYNRARLAFYNIDPIFYNTTSSLSPTLADSRNELSNHYVREVLEQEVFPYKQSVTGQPLSLPTLDLAFYPKVRGPYNFATTGINTDGSLQNPQTRWGGIFRRMDSNDFESLNVQYIEFWMLDPFIYNRNSAGGDLYFNLGSLSEDILKDGRKSLENGLPADGDVSKVDSTVWGRVPKLQPVVQSFDNDQTARTLQDVGLDGLGNADERQKYAPFIRQIRSTLNTTAANQLISDPSSDDYLYFRGPAYDEGSAGILKRYSQYNGTEGNSKTTEQSKAQLGLDNSASTSLPDGEDVNRDNNMSQADEYFQYKVSIRPQNLVVGQNFIADKVTSSVKLANGTTQSVTWYQFRVPIKDYQSKVGNIQDFKAIRFIRMFMTNFADTSVLRFARMQLIRGEWRAFNTENSTANVIADPAIVNPPLDNSTIDVSTVNIEENGNRVPIPYVVPPGITRQRDYNNYTTNTQLNEQALQTTVTNLRDGYSKATFKTFSNDLRQYKELEMFIHAEGTQLQSGDVSAFIRLGVDYIDNYYEYEIPLQVTASGTRDADGIWPVANRLAVQLSVLTQAKTARNNALLNGAPWPLTVPFTFTDGTNRVTIKGQPDLSRLRTIMLGVRNPYKGNSPAGKDDGLDKTAIVWFNELRLTGFNEQGGWAAIGRFNAKLADLGDVSISGSKSTVGFGTLDSRISDRSLSDKQSVDMSANMELGKFFPTKSGVKIPVYASYSNQIITPKYDPANPDIELKQELAQVSQAKKDSIINVSEDYTVRKSINLTNVRKTKTDPKAKSHLWDVENLSATYAYTEYDHHDFVTENAFQKNYIAQLNYVYNNQPKFYSPFSKIIKSNMLKLFQDINFSLLPSRLNFNINLNRFYSENTLRNNDPENFIAIPTTYSKSFQINRVYGIGWNLTKSLQMDFDATNLGVIDEPTGRINGLKQDTLWNNLKKLGRTVNYTHTINFNYTTPINKIPGFDWTNMSVRYSTQFNWNSQALFSLQDPTLNVGNTIQNSRTIQLNPVLNFTGLYNKFSFLRKANESDKGGITNLFLHVLTSVKNVSGTYTRTEGTFLPGYLPKTKFFGEDLNYNAPGIGFLLGSQADIRSRAISSGWITTDSLQNQLFTKTLLEDMHLRGVLEPIPDLRIELSAFRTRNMNYQTNFKYSALTGDIENLSPITTGDYSISYFTLPTAFLKSSGINNTSSVFQKFLDNRNVISQRLGRSNPNSTRAITNGFADGYGANAQDVLVPAFLAAYSGKDANSISTGSFPKIPIPNWDIRYNGLSKIPFLAEYFDSFDLSHGYRSAYSVNGFNTLLRYSEANGAVNVRDANNDFLPYYQYSQITIFEQFVPLLGLDARFKNSITTHFEYRKSRALSLSLLNSQLTQQNESNIVFGFGYHTTNFRFPFGLFNNLILKNDMTFKFDFALTDNKTVIYRPDVQEADISSGAKNITVRPSINYVINQRFNMQLFYDSNITKPYTSQSFNTAFTNFGVNLKLLFQ